MPRKIAVLLYALVAVAVVVAAPISSSLAGDEVRRVAIHVDQNDPKLMNLALNNAENVTKYYTDKGQKVEVRIVAYGPGLHMYRADTSPVKARIEKMALQHENISFAACGNTHRKMSEKAGKQVAIIEEAKMVPSGVVELIELQRQGWNYIRP